MHINLISFSPGKRFTTCSIIGFPSTLIKISTKKKIEDGIYLRKLKNSLEIYNKITNEKISVDLKKLKITEVEHNFQNLLAIYAVNFILKSKSFNFLNSLKKLSNLEHRIEFIGKYKNIRFYNDSKATNAISAKNAIQSFENIFWILGGVKKEGGLKGIESSFKSVLLAFNFGQSKYEFHNFLKKGIKFSNWNKRDPLIKAPLNFELLSLKVWVNDSKFSNL